MRYRQKVDEVEAHQVNGTHLRTLAAALNARVTLHSPGYYPDRQPPDWTIEVHVRGDATPYVVSFGDYMVRNRDGEWGSVSQESFERRYEPAGDS